MLPFLRATFVVTGELAEGNEEVDRAHVDHAGHGHFIAVSISLKPVRELNLGARRPLIITATSKKVGLKLTMQRSWIAITLFKE